MTGEERPLNIKLTNPGNIDWWYGSGNTAYNTVQDAINTVPQAIRLGKTVGVLSGNTIVEMWWASGTTDTDLVVKSDGAVDLSDYYTKEQADSKFLTGYTVDFSNYYDKATSDSRFQPVGNYLTGITASEVDSALGFTPENAANKNAVNGYAGLDSSGLLSLNLFPDKLLGNVKYKGTYDGNVITSSDNSLNGLALPISNSGTTGFYFILTSGVTNSGITYNVGDWIISDGDAGWNRVQNSDAVTTVFGRNGNIVANANDYATYYLPVSSGATITANTASINNVQSSLNNYQLLSGKDVNGGYVGRDSSGNIKVSAVTINDTQMSAGSGSIFTSAVTSTSFAGMNMFNSAGVLAASFQYGGSGTGQWANNMLMGPRLVGGSLLFIRNANATESARINQNGRFLLNTTTDNNVDLLQVNGSVLTSQINGSSSASGNLTLASTSNTTKGKIYLGSSGNVWLDEPSSSLVFNGSVIGITINSGDSHPHFYQQYGYTIMRATSNGVILMAANGSNGLIVDNNARVNLGYSSTATAKVHFGAGSSSASGAGLKLAPGVTGQTTTELGAVNFDGNNVYIGTTGTTSATGTTNLKLIQGLSDVTAVGNTTNTDVEITNAANGIILKDAGDGTRRRITVVNGVLTVSAPL